MAAEVLLENNIVPPNREYLEMNFAHMTATQRGANNHLIMEALPDGETFKVTEGRVGIRVGPNAMRFKGRFPMEQWDDYYAGKILRGYILTKSVKMDKVEIKKITQNAGMDNYKPLESFSVTNIIQRLMGFVTAVIKENFTVKVEDISDEMLELGRQTLVELSEKYETMSVAEFNAKLQLLFAAVPRRIDRMSKFLAKRPEDFEKIITAETELYEIIYDQVRSGNVVEVDDRKTILEAYGLEWRDVTEDEETWIKKKLESNANQYVHAWRITNKMTEERFNDFCEKNSLSEKDHGICHLFHGSATENFWSIVTTGLKINPIGVRICGKAYGLGTYFAPAACKSLGYSSRCGSKWANGNQNTGFLGIYKVATGTKDQRYNGSRGCDNTITWQKLQSIQKGAYSTWAECRYSGFMMDEVIVYQDAQSTIEYLVEVSA